jgi:hypothetical protein
MKDIPPLKIFILVVIIILGGIILKPTEKPVETILERQESEFVLVLGDSIQATSVYLIDTQTLGILIAREEKIPGLIDKLSICESGGNNLAINPRDTDGTPSYGEFQFKTTTWEMYVKRYDLFEWQNFDEADWYNTMMADDLQRIVVEKMFCDKNVRLVTTEFPTCARRLGLKQNYAI